MRIVDPMSGRSYLEKRRRRHAAPGQQRELTFSCYRGLPFLSRARTQGRFHEALQGGREEFSFQLWAYVVMPEHVDLLVYPGEHAERVSKFPQALKEPVARHAVEHLKATPPRWLERLRVREGQRIRHRFWQPSGGYDRNIMSASALRSAIDYLHANPVRRGLVVKGEDWKWSSASWFAGIRPVGIEMDGTVLEELARDGIGSATGPAATNRLFL